MAKNYKYVDTIESPIISSQIPLEEKEEIVGGLLTVSPSALNCLCSLCENNQNAECLVCKGKGNLSS